MSSSDPAPKKPSSSSPPAAPKPATTPTASPPHPALSPKGTAPDANVPIKPPRPGMPIPKSPPSATRQPTGLTQLTTALKGAQSGVGPNAASGLQPRVSGIIPKARTSTMPLARPAGGVPATSAHYPAAKEGLSKAARSVHDPRSNTGFVPAIREAAPASQRGKHISALTHAIQLNCRVCRKSILDAGPDSKVEKAGAGFICAECVSARKAGEAARGRVLRAGAIASVAGLILFAFILPGQASLFAAIAGVIFALTGLLAHDTRRIWRYAMLAFGLLAISGGIVGMIRVAGSAQRDQAHGALSEESKAIQDLLEKNQFADAQGRYRTLRADAAAGKYAADEEFAQQAIADSQSRLDEWLKNRFGSISDEERALALALVAKYPDNAAKGPHIQGVSFKENAVTVRAVTSSDAAAAAEVRSVLLFLFETYPQLQKIRLETPAGVYENTRDLVPQLRYGGVPSRK